MSQRSEDSVIPAPSISYSNLGRPGCVRRWYRGPGPSQVPRLADRLRRTTEPIQTVGAPLRQPLER